jgi:hypothetical protein
MLMCYSKGAYRADHNMEKITNILMDINTLGISKKSMRKKAVIWLEKKRKWES